MSQYYSWKIQDGNLSAEGTSKTLHAAIDNLVYYSRGNRVRDFYINGHHMNEEFSLWIEDDKVVHDDGSEFVAMNRWYELLGVPAPSENEESVMTKLNNELERIFRPQPSRGSAPTNPSTLLAKGEGL